MWRFTSAWNLNPATTTSLKSSRCLNAWSFMYPGWLSSKSFALSKCTKMLINRLLIGMVSKFCQMKFRLCSSLKVTTRIFFVAARVSLLRPTSVAWRKTSLSNRILLFFLLRPLWEKMGYIVLADVTVEPNSGRQQPSSTIDIRPTSSRCEDNPGNARAFNSRRNRLRLDTVSISGLLAAAKQSRKSRGLVIIASVNELNPL